MKKIILTFALLFMVVAITHAITFREAFERIAQLPNLPGVTEDITVDLENGWLKSLPLEKGITAYKIHEVGSEQTIYYGSKVAEIVNELPKEKIIRSSTNTKNLIYIYATPISDYNYEILILIDMAVPGKTVAVIGEVQAPIIEAIKEGNIILENNKITVEVPLIICE